MAASSSLPGAGRHPVSASRGPRAPPSGPLRVLFVGNLIPRKGLLVLIAALGRLPRGTWRLTVVGSPVVDPGYAARVRRAVRDLGLQDSVRMRGQMDDAGLAAELRVHHVLAVPSLYEGFGIVYLEAMGFRRAFPSGPDTGVPRRSYGTGSQAAWCPRGMRLPSRMRCAVWQRIADGCRHLPAGPWRASVSSPAGAKEWRRRASTCTSWQRRPE